MNNIIERISHFIGMLFFPVMGCLLYLGVLFGIKYLLTFPLTEVIIAISSYLILCIILVYIDPLLFSKKN